MRDHGSLKNHYYMMRSVKKLNNGRNFGFTPAVLTAPRILENDLSEVADHQSISKSQCKLDNTLRSRGAKRT